ncbi:MAG: hypothetical protein ACXAEF_09195 [Candidatus Thorarchaeota archaeon]
MSSKTTMQGIMYLICMGLAGASAYLGYQSNPSTISMVSYMAAMFALIWLLTAIWAFKRIGTVQYTDYDVDVDKEYSGVDYDVYSATVTSSQRRANQNVIGFYAGLGMVIMVFLFEGMYNPMALFYNLNLLLSLGAGILSILVSWVLR